MKRTRKPGGGRKPVIHATKTVACRLPVDLYNALMSNVTATYTISDALRTIIDCHYEEAAECTRKLGY